MHSIKIQLAFPALLFFIAACNNQQDKNGKIFREIAYYNGALLK